MDRCEEITQRTLESMEGFELRQVHEDGSPVRAWILGRPGSNGRLCHPCVTVASWPGFLTVTWINRAMTLSRTEDMVSWLLGAVRSPGYLFEKLCSYSPGTDKDWDSEAFLQFFDEMIEEDEELPEEERLWTPDKVAEVRATAQNGPGWDSTRCYEEVLDVLKDDVDDAWEWVSCGLNYVNGLWGLRAALMKFCELYQEQAECR